MDHLIQQDEIRNELNRVLSSKSFLKSPILSKFLAFVVENTLEGHSNILKEYTIATHVLGRPLDFTPQSDASVRVNGIRLRKLLTEYYDEQNGETRLRIELRKGSYVPNFTHIEKAEHAAAHAEHEGGSIHEDVICILPFNGFIYHPTLDFSFTGFCEYLSEKLSHFQDIKVVSFHSASRFMEQDGRLNNIGKALGVSSYLTGSIEVEKEQLSVSYQLHDAQSQVLIWSQQMYAPLHGTAAMEAADTITSKIVASLAGYSGLIHYRLVMDKNHAPPISDKMANAIFWFYHYQVNHTAALYYQAIERLETVVAEDARCELCWAVLAHLYADALIYHYTTAKNPIETAQACVNKALELNPNCQHAYLVKAWVKLLMQNKQEALENLEKSYEINPNSAMFRGFYCLGLSFLGNYEKSLSFLASARQLNPLPYWWMNLPEIFWALKNQDYEKVLFYARKSSTPKVIFEHVFEMIGYYYLGDMGSLKTVLKGYREKYPDGLAFLGKALPAILADDELGDKISYALQQIDQINNISTSV